MTDRHAITSGSALSRTPQDGERGCKHGLIVCCWNREAMAARLRSKVRHPDSGAETGPRRNIGSMWIEAVNIPWARSGTAAHLAAAISHRVRSQEANNAGPRRETRPLASARGLSPRAPVVLQGYRRLRAARRQTRFCARRGQLIVCFVAPCEGIFTDWPDAQTRHNRNKTVSGTLHKADMGGWQANWHRCHIADRFQIAD